MTTDRDALTLKPRAGWVHATAPLKAREARMAAPMLDDRRGYLARFVRLAARRKAVRIGEEAFSAARGFVSRAAPAAGESGAAGLGTTVAIAVALGVVILRLGSGMPLEGAGEQVNQILMGDQDEKARATMATRQQMESDPNILRVMSRTGADNPQINAIFDGLNRINMQKELGASKLRQAYPANSWLDILILQARDAMVKYWKEHGGEAALDKIKLGLLILRIISPRFY